jgi:5-methylcytosine-specific restriction endonuclease McrA
LRDAGRPRTLPTIGAVSDAAPFVVPDVPRRPPSTCSVAGCSNPARNGRCVEHRRRADRIRRRAPWRGSFYSSKEWAAIRAAVLADSIWCECGPDCCAVPRCIAPATVVDHISPRRVELAAGRDPERRSNLAALAKRCHDRKTAAESGIAGAR